MERQKSGEEEPTVPRRSSRPNLGVPPDRLGEWIEGLPDSHTSTRIQTSSGSRQTGVTAVPRTNMTREADDVEPSDISQTDKSRASTRKSKASSYLDSQIKKLEKSVEEKLSRLIILKDVRDGIEHDEEDSQKLSDDESQSVILKDAAGGAGVTGQRTTRDEDAERISRIYKEAFGSEKMSDFADYDEEDHEGGIPSQIEMTGNANYFPTPKPRLWKPSMQQNAPETSIFKPLGKTQNPPPTRPRTRYEVFKPASQPMWNAPRHYYQPPQPNPRTFGGASKPVMGPRFSAQPQSQPIDGGVDALANALITALQTQNTNTERFVARHSSSQHLPSFSGNPLDWPLFAHHYRQSTKDGGYTLSQNMSRLEKALRGEARATVKALMIVPSNSDAVMERLEQRYGKPEYVVRALVDLAKKTPSPKEGKLSNILDFANAVNNLVDTIHSLHVPAHLENPQLLMELVDKLPDTLKLQWGMYKVNQGGGNMETFSTWIMAISEAAGEVTIPKFSLKDGKEKKEESSHVAEESAKVVKSRSCPVCKEESHNLASCEKFKQLKVSDRWDLIKKNNLCYRCMKGGHSIKICKSRQSCKIDGCNRRHHTLLHGNPPGNPPSTSNKEKSADDRKEKKTEELNATLTSVGGVTILRIVVVRIYGPAGEVTANALLDEGSTVTLISAKVADDLGLRGNVDPLRIKWMDGKLQEDRASRKVDCWIGPEGVKAKYKLKSVRTVNNLCLPEQRTDLKEIVLQYPHLQSQKMKYLPGERPLILLGQQHAHLSVAREVIEKDDMSPMFTQTKLGWVLHGPMDGKVNVESSFLCQHETDDDLLHRLVKESFALEAIGIRTNTNTRSREDIAAEEKMKKITTRVGDRWQTGLLWRSDNPVLPPSRNVAEFRLKCVERKLQRNPQLAEQYKEKLLHYVKSGYARKLSHEELSVKSDVEWYLPHFDTTHPNKPGKIRIVLDAASRSRGVSLNDFLYTGPDLLVSLPGLLIKFRERKIAISGDITEMFHQVRIRPEDCPAQRFLWREADDQEPSVFQFEVLMFGSVCSPYCAQYVKNLNAMEFQKEYPATAAAIIDHHYMDDWLQSMDTELAAIKLIREVILVHKKGGMDIGKWVSNSRGVLEEIKGEASSDQTKNLAEWSEIKTERALGLHWIPRDDAFAFKVNLDRAGVGIANGNKIPTKRAVLRLVMLVWDPLGFLGHYLVKARILLQDLWKRKIGWDDELNESQLKKWKIWIADLPSLSTIRIIRCYSDHASSSSNVQLHIYADSSEQASCAIAYFRVLEANGEITVTMLMSKTRVAPVKPISVPRLELTAALLAARLGRFLKSELDIPIHSVTFWTDSMTTLRWIRSEARRFQQFVAVRVGEIQELTDISEWRWVPSAENPADDGTREGKVNLKPDSRWWNGPDFLKLPPEEFPHEPKYEKATQDEEQVMELKREFSAVIVSVPSFSLPEVVRFASYLKLVRSTANVLKFICKLRKRDPCSNIEVMKDAEKLLFKRSQWESFPDEMQLLTNGSTLSKNSRLFQLTPVLEKDGVLHMDSRLVTATEEGIRSPIILHPKNELTRLLLVHYHKLHHHAGEDLVKNEVRQRFWIPHLRSSIRKVIRECIVCRKRRIQVKPPIMGALPDVKIHPQPRAFYVCGMDYFGPVDVTVGRRHEKRYGVLFTCMNTRAVHLEVAASLTTDSCIMAIRRMIARRGQPSKMYSDNGTNLRGAEKELRLALEELDAERMTGELEAKGIEWHFIPPSAAHMGGSWERLVRSVKVAMATILKCRAPKEEVLQTVLAEAEAVVNSRPLMDVPVDPESPEALTPFHFLIGTSSPNSIPGDFDASRLELKKQWRQAQTLADQFWRRWVREYLPTLQRRAKWHEQRPSIHAGDIVVVLDESLRRGTWPLGLVTATFPGKDGVVRVVEVKTSSGVYKRPVVKLGKLDISAKKQDED